MDILNLLQNDKLNLPLKNNTNEDFRNFLESQLENYYDLLSKMPKKFVLDTGEAVVFNQFMSNSRILIDGIIDTIDLYYDGRPHLAYEKLKTTIANSGVSPYLDHAEINSAKDLYRARSIKNNYAIPKKDLFHIPFHLRSLISSQRFSIPGFPSLYLGNSAYVIWEELKRPDIDSMQVSKFNIHGSLKILLLINTANQRNKYIQNKIPTGRPLLNFLFTWPLNAACCTKAKNNLSSFVPEYIVPQLLTQFIRDGVDFKGISYSSTHIDINPNSENYYMNYVFPVSDNNVTGHCESLSDRFVFTDPISNHLIKASTQGDHTTYITSGDRTPVNSDITQIELIKNQPADYNDTVFADIEIRLKRMTSLKIHQ